jgi:hypothetical protein
VRKPGVAQLPHAQIVRLAERREVGLRQIGERLGETISKVWHRWWEASLEIQVLLIAEAVLATPLVGARPLSPPRTAGVRKVEWRPLFELQKLGDGESILWRLFHDLEYYEQISHLYEASQKGWTARS